MLRPKNEAPRGILHRRSDAPLAGYARYWPDADLAPYIEHLWTVEWDLDAPHTSEVLTHPSFQLVVEQDASALAGVFTGRYRRVKQGKGRVLGVKFHPGAIRPWIGRPASEYADRTVPLREPFGEEAEALERRALSQGSHAEAFAVIQEFLRSRRPPHDPTIELVSAIVRRVAADRTIVRVEQLVTGCAIPLRRLQRLLGDYVGVGPKWIIQRYRLHEAAERIAAGGVRDFAALAFDLGYSDQAHFIRDFRRLVGYSPASYARSLATPPAGADRPGPVR